MILSQNDTSSMGWGIFITLILGALGGVCNSWIWRWCSTSTFFLHVDIWLTEFETLFLKQIVTLVWLSYRLERRIFWGILFPTFFTPALSWHGMSSLKENDSLKEKNNGMHIVKLSNYKTSSWLCLIFNYLVRILLSFLFRTSPDINLPHELPILNSNHVFPSSSIFNSWR